MPTESRPARLCGVVTLRRALSASDAGPSLHATAPLRGLRLRPQVSSWRVWRPRTVSSRYVHQGLRNRPRSAPPQAPPAPPAPPVGELFEWHGNAYQKKKDPPVNGTWSVNDTQQYVGSLDPNLNVPPYDAEFDVPFDSVEDNILGLPTSYRAEDSRFAWPVEGLSFQKAFTVALHHLPPGCMIAIRSGQPLATGRMARDGRSLAGQWWKPSG